jgi:diguanylate cyclase (GGDEF)-like protein
MSDEKQRSEKPTLRRLSVPQISEDDGQTTRDTERTYSVAAGVTAERATLTVITGVNAGEVFAFSAWQHVVGRSSEADFRVDDAAVSRRHARISHMSDGRFVLEDLGTTNGTFVGGQPTTSCELRSGDRIQLGPNLLLRFALTDASEEAMQRRLFESSTRDGLTGVFNRAHFFERLEAEVAHARRHHGELGLLMLDLDWFKVINDRYGHLVGDRVLCAVADVVGRLIRVEDIFARYGGEEFVLLARSTPHDDALRLAERIRDAVRTLAIRVVDQMVSVTLSIGVASLSEVGEGVDPVQLIGLADSRLYRAKAAGRNRVCGEG